MSESARSKRLRLRNQKKQPQIQQCPPNIKPIYYNNSLVAEPDDTVRAFLVMEFPYQYPDGSINIVRQCFYRSSGHNSNEQFGDDITDMQARGTWIPTNGLVAVPGHRDMNRVCVMNNQYSFILKEPFVNLQSVPLLRRFHSDPQLAFISYLMGGGIWRLSNIVKRLSSLMSQSYPKQFNQGCININDNIITLSPKEINNYIGDAVSWNWHPIDEQFLQISTLEKVDLRDPILYIQKHGQDFIPKALLNSPAIIKNYLKSGLRRIPNFTEDKIKELSYQSVSNTFNVCP